jgi:dTDP-4-amino-4,6-dideoxygalactose transaminase
MNEIGEMTTPYIPMYRPIIEREEFDACRESLENGWLGMGSYVAAFEAKLKECIGAPDRHVVAVSTGHAALHLGLLLLGVGPDDEVITPSFNNAADFQAILATGAKPVFCDVDDDTLCIDLAKAEALISPRTRALIVMDYDCILCDHDRVARLAKRHGLRVLHDAAHSLGSKYKGRPIGSFSDVTMFSFDPVKTVTCIDGGALVVRDDADVARLHEMRLIGMTQPAKVMYSDARAWTYDIRALGFRYHLANLHAALGLAQLSKLETFAENRRRACRYYNRELAGVPGVRTPQSDFTDVVPFLYYIRVPPERRDELRRFLGERGVDTGIHWQPGHWFTLLKDCRRGDLSVTERIGREILSLPLHSKMSGDALERIVDGVRSFFN